MVIRYRYTEWDGSQEIPPLAPDDILNALTDDLMNFGDLQHALRNLMQRGMRNPMGDRTQGLRDMLQQLRQQRRQQLDRFNLSSAFEDIQKKLQEILDKERGTLEDRQNGNQGQQDGSPQDGDPSSADGDEGAGEESGMEAGEGQTGPRGQQGGQQQRSRSQQGQSGQRGQQQPGSQGGQQSGQGGESGDQEQQFADLLNNILERKRNFLEALPNDLGGQMKELQNYEFMNKDAEAEFQELMQMLKKAMTETFFKDLQNQISNMSPEDMERMKQMMKDLNQMLQDRMQGKEPDFDSFMQQYGDLFGPNPPQSLDELVEQMQRQMSQMQNLLDSLPSDMRQQLQDLLMDKIADPELRDQMSELAANLEYLYPQRDLRNQYPFRGDEEIDLSQAMDLMGDMQDMDELERQLERTQYGGDIDDIDAEKLRELLGDEAADTLDQLKQFLEILEEAGYIRKRGSNYELTPRGTRKIGQAALGEIYAQLKKEQAGKHKVADPGRGVERSDDTKAYEFGDPFHLHLEKTIMNALKRDGAQMPVRLQRDDFEVWKSEQLTQTTTVLMVDLSWSMALRGSFQAAKKVALALQNLITTQFARDSLYI
ncbi:MAG: VWA domain-containing protein, partial [Dehalococcoidia bacterium]